MQENLMVWVVSGTLWSDILGHLTTNQAPLVRSWFNRLEPLGLMHGTLEVQTNTTAQYEYLTRDCGDAFNEAAQAATGRLVAVRFRAPARAEQLETERPLSFEAETNAASLNPDYTFDNFVVGPCNRLAHAACVGVSEAPGTTYNPLFIHGNVGLGKTHLLQAACHRICGRNGQPRIAFLSCETFTNHFIEAVERGALHQFRYRYRLVDAIVIDDIQFLAARDRSQEEFFHTFNTLFQARKQIILSADSAPKGIDGIEDRLVSRFNWGLVTSIDAPDLETRIAIVKKKSRIRCIELPDDVAYYIASNIDSNTRELEGAILKVDAVAQQHGGRISLEIAQMALRDEVTVQRPEVSVPQILDAVVKQFNVSMSDLQSKKRSRSIAFARQVCMYLARELTRLSLEEIGNCFGGRDHTTVLHASRLIGNLRGEDGELDRTLARLTEELRKR
ncbi:MAG: chromosomal replication initiator protein DnaA [Phycisphaerae bacterium]|nr:chromosomal replication initiator protein DnaA [Phycisphaerae bacterium]